MTQLSLKELRKFTNKHINEKGWKHFNSPSPSWLTSTCARQPPRRDQISWQKIIKTSILPFKLHNYFLFRNFVLFSIFVLLNMRKILMLFAS